jgi:hypothetical protein
MTTRKCYRTLASELRAISVSLYPARVVTGLRPVQVYSVRWLPVGTAILELLYIDKISHFLHLQGVGCPSACPELVEGFAPVLWR